jgi:hypothetical protein
MDAKIRRISVENIDIISGIMWEALRVFLYYSSFIVEKSVRPYLNQVIMVNITSQGDK